VAEQPAWDGDMGRSWARLHAATDRQMAEVGAAVLGLLDAKPGERVIDLGCGAGSTTLAIAEAVGPGGRATGVDVSPDLVAAARARTRSSPQVVVVEADAAAHDFEPGAHDALFSRHGCMFFDNPPAAFANIRRGLKPGARVALSAFGPLAENPWAGIPLGAVEAALGPAPPQPQGQPGPFAWADPAAIEAALGGGGFAAIRCEGRTVSFAVGAGDDPDPVERACRMVLSIGPVARRVREAGGDAEARVRPALAAALAPHVRDGWVRLPARIWLVEARA